MDALFDLVMVVERLNESLVLLRDLLCWEMDDVVMFKINARRSVFQRPPEASLANELRKLNAVDTRLYEYFAKRFEQRVKAFGAQRMQSELKLLEQRTRYWYQKCVARDNESDKSGKFYIYHSQVLTYEVKDTSTSLCDLMTLPEIIFTGRLRVKQLKRIATIR
ncbi:hypothetical protein V5799_023492 [Amblyomma americanum]|uniref:Uncharacterized protein n=1 Tax=Amblyomma americanum TaxID=6943 RepID=A0AAQ4FJF1_AMBAM